MPGRILVFVLLAVALFAAPAPAQNREPGEELFLAGRMLVAAPRLADPRFHKSVIVLIRHDRDGAFGLIVNRAVGSGSLKNFLKGLGREGGERGGDLAIHYGGPVQADLGFVLHSADFAGAGSQAVPGGLAWSPAPDVLEAASKGEGPKRLLFALGYSGWGPGQLDGEIARGDWLIAPADETLIFETTGDAAWDRARAGAAMRL